MRICFYRKKFLFVLLALSVANLLESTLELWNAGTGYSIHVAAVAALEEVVGNSGNHSPVVAAKLERREYAVEVASFCQHCAEAGVCCNTAATNYSLKAGIICGLEQFSNQSFDCCFLEGGTHVFCAVFVARLPE